MMGESSLAALQWRRPSCVPSEKTASGRRSLMPSFVNSREFLLIPREFRASVPPCTAPAALHFQGDPQNDAAAAAEGLRTVSLDVSLLHVPIHGRGLRISLHRDLVRQNP